MQWEKEDRRRKNEVEGRRKVERAERRKREIR